MKLHKAPVCDRVSEYHIMYVGAKLHGYVRKLLSMMLLYSNTFGIIILCIKKGSQSINQICRPLNLLPEIYKLFQPVMQSDCRLNTWNTLNSIKFPSDQQKTHQVKTGPIKLYSIFEKLLCYLLNRDIVCMPYLTSLMLKYQISPTVALMSAPHHLVRRVQSLRNLNAAIRPTLYLLQKISVDIYL